MWAVRNSYIFPTIRTAGKLTRQQAFCDSKARSIFSVQTGTILSFLNYLYYLMNYCPHHAISDHCLSRLQIEVSWRANLVWFGLVGCLTRLGISGEHRRSLVWFTEVISHRKSWVKNKEKRWERLSPHYSLRQVPRRRLMFRKKGSQLGPVHLDKGDHLSCGQPIVRPDSEPCWRLWNLGLAVTKVIPMFAFAFIKGFRKKHEASSYSYSYHIH